MPCRIVNATTTERCLFYVLFSLLNPSQPPAPSGFILTHRARKWILWKLFVTPILRPGSLASSHNFEKMACKLNPKHIHVAEWKASVVETPEHTKLKNKKRRPKGFRSIFFFSLLNLFLCLYRFWRWTTWGATWLRAPLRPSRPRRTSWPTRGSWTCGWSSWTCPTRSTGATTPICASCSRPSTRPTLRIRSARWRFYTEMSSVFADQL